MKTNHHRFEWKQNNNNNKMKTIDLNQIKCPFWFHTIIDSLVEYITESVEYLRISSWVVFFANVIVWFAKASLILSAKVH